MFVKRFIFISFNFEAGINTRIPHYFSQSLVDKQEEEGYSAILSPSLCKWDPGHKNDSALKCSPESLKNSGPPAFFPPSSRRRKGWGERETIQTLFVSV